MKRFSKKFLSIMLVSSLMMSTACGNSGGNKDGGGNANATQKTNGEMSYEDSILNPPGVFPIVKEPVTLTIFAPADGENSRLTNAQTLEIEELTGIKIDWQIAASSDNIKEKLSTMFASKNMTDIILTGVSSNNRLDKATEAMMGNQGLVIPLNDLIDEYSVGYKDAFDKVEGLEDAITTPDGYIYSLPNVDGSLHVQYPSKLWINTKWLENLGLEMPTTTEEFEMVMKAFKEQDANGNGDPNDEIPLSTISGTASGIALDGFLMNPFQLTPDKEKFYIDNGKVTYAATTDGYKEGLKYINNLYEKGYINPESFTQDLTNQVNINEAGEQSVIGAFLAGRPGYANDLSTIPNSKKWEQYQCLPPIEGPNGQRIANWNPYAQYQTGMTFISSSCEYPKVAFRLLDYLATEEGSTRSALGIKDVHWRDAKSGELGIDGEPAKYARTGESQVNQSWTQLAGLIRTREWIEDEAVNQDPYAEGVAPLNGRQIVLYRGSLEYEKYQQPYESVLPPLYMSAENSSEVSLLSTNIIDTQKEYLVEFITGSKDIDKEWDTYKKSLSNVGLDKYIEIIQSAYDVSVYAK